MKARGITHKSEAIRIAVQEAAGRSSRQPGAVEELRSWVGLAASPTAAHRPKFASDDDLGGDKP